MKWILFRDDKLEVRRMRFAGETDHVDAGRQVAAIDVNIIRLACDCATGKQLPDFSARQGVQV